MGQNFIIFFFLNSVSKHCLAGWKNSRPSRVLKSKDHIAGLSSELTKGKLVSSETGFSSLFGFIWLWIDICLL